MSAAADWPIMAGLSPDGPAGLALLAVAAAAAGAINSVAGGGTILTFPVLGMILPPDPGRLVTANATSTLGLWPASLAASWAYRSDRARQPAWTRWLLLPSVVGAAVGVALVLALPERLFAGAVPWLILLAAVLFAAQPRLAAVAHGGGRAATATPSPARIVAACSTSATSTSSTPPRTPSRRRSTARRPWPSWPATRWACTTSPGSTPP
jgi:uncharacterized membrane protein YfcA